MRDTAADLHLPISKTIKTILRFLDPGFTSLIKITASLEIFDISEADASTPASNTTAVCEDFSI